MKYCNISGTSWLISPLQLMPQTICWLVAFGVWTSTRASHCGVYHGEVRMPNSPKLWLWWAILHLPCFAIRRRFHRGCAVPFPPRIAWKFTFVSAVHTASPQVYYRIHRWSSRNMSSSLRWFLRLVGLDEYTVRISCKQKVFPHMRTNEGLFHRIIQ